MLCSPVTCAEHAPLLLLSCVSLTHNLFHRHSSTLLVLFCPSLYHSLPLSLPSPSLSLPYSPLPISPSPSPLPPLLSPSPPSPSSPFLSHSQQNASDGTCGGLGTGRRCLDVYALPQDKVHTHQQKSEFSAISFMYTNVYVPHALTTPT